MTLLCALALAFAAVLVLPGRAGRAGRGRLAGLRPPPVIPTVRARSVPEGALQRSPVRLAAGAVAGMAAGWLTGGAPGWLIGVLVAAAVPRLIGRLPSGVDQEPALAADLPLVLELVASCLRAGAPLPVALAGSAEVAGPALRAVLVEVVAQLELGADPARAWQIAAGSEALTPLVATAVRAGDSGAAFASALRGLAAEQRVAQRHAQDALVERTGVFVVVPLGLCFLPAFVLVAVVPIVVGLAGQLAF